MMWILVVDTILVIAFATPFGIISKQVIVVPLRSAVTFSANSSDLSGKFTVPLRTEMLNITKLILIARIDEASTNSDWDSFEIPIAGAEIFHLKYV